MKQCPRQGPAHPFPGRMNSRPLSLVKMTIVFSRTPVFSTAPGIWPTLASTR
jgi:hypothetical protein